MSSNTEGYFDIDECLRARELVNFKSKNMYMLITSESIGDGQIRGEREIRSPYGGGGFTGLIDVHGYFFTGHNPQGNSKTRYRSMTIIKRTDIAIPSLLHVFNANEDIMSVGLSVFHHNQREISAQPWKSSLASDPSRGSKPPDSWFTINLSQVKIRAMSTFTSKHSHIPLDIISFDFRVYQMKIHRLTDDLNGMTSLMAGANQCGFDIKFGIQT